MTKALLLVLANIIIGLIGQICIKSAMSQADLVTGLSLHRLPGVLFQIFTTPLIWVALPLYGLAFAMWAIALSRLDLSFAYPLLSLGYVVTPLVAAIVFKEPFPLTRWIGIGFVVIGVSLIGQTGR